MATFRHGTATPDRPGTVRARRSSAPTRLAALVAGLAMVGLLSACGTENSAGSTPQTLSGTAEPASGDPTTDGVGSSPANPTGDTPGSATATDPGTTTPDTSTTGSATTRCHTSDLSASVGSNDPGAGQENFPIVFTNGSDGTCTLRGFPGAAFVDASGKQLGPDPERSSESPTTVTLAPGEQAWSGLTFANPEVSGAGTATPAALLVTPPDEKDSLKVKWTQGKVPVSGNSSTASLTVVRPGAGS